MAVTGSKKWQTKRAENSLRATEMDFWRRAAGKSKLEKIRIEHMLVEDIQIAQLKWYEHV